MGANRREQPSKEHGANVVALAVGLSPDTILPRWNGVVNERFEANFITPSQPPDVGIIHIQPRRAIAEKVRSSIG